MTFTINFRLTSFLLLFFVFESGPYCQVVENEAIKTLADFGIKTQIREWVRITSLRDNAETDTSVYRFDSKGRMTFFKNRNGSRTIEFDNQGRIVHCTDLDKNGDRIKETSYAYTDSSRTIREQIPGGKEKLTFSIIKDGKIVSERINDGRQFVNVYIYLPASRGYWRTLKDSSGTFYEKEHRFYDPEGRLTERKIESRMQFEGIEMEKRSYHSHGHIKLLENYTDVSGNSDYRETSFDTLGRELKVIEYGYMPLGEHEYHDTTIYAYSINANGALLSQKKIRLKGSVEEVKYVYYQNGELKQEDHYEAGENVKRVMHLYN